MKLPAAQIRQAGGRIVCVPEMAASYIPRDTLPALARQYLRYGRYRVKKVLGVGGMGRVYLSNDTRLANRPVAVKEMIVGDGIQEKKAIEDFTREANVLARV